MKKILHIVQRDKFTAGYINSMLLTMQSYNHIFITTGDKEILQVVDADKVTVIYSYRDLLTNSRIRKLLYDSDKIIISGVFGIQRYLCFLSNDILRKISLQFWGGDFYGYRGLKFCFRIKELKRRINRWCLKYIINKCDSLLFLIEGDYLEYLKIIKIPKKYFIVPMPKNPKMPDDYSEFSCESIKNRILVGNSATRENQHKEVLDSLKSIGGDLEIVCPLSYGDKEYRNEIIKYGKNLFGEQFLPLVEFYERKDYIRKLSTCEIGIFNNNRQQALGNIYIMLALGRKVYIRKDTPMWEYFKSFNIKVYDINTLKDCEISKIFYIPEEDRINNMSIISKGKKNSIEKWSVFLNTVK